MPSTRSRPSSRRPVAGLIATVAVVLLFLTSCGADDPGTSPGATADETTGERTSLVDDDDALRWGDGSYGVVLAHGAAFDAASWEEQAVEIAAQDASVVAVEDLTPEALRAAVEVLRDEGVDGVALVGGSAGADASLRLLSEEPDLVDQLVMLSANSVVDDLGDQPKLFIASEEEPVADVSVELAETAPGDDNEVLLLPGADHAQNIFDGEQADVALTALLERLDQR